MKSRIFLITALIWLMLFNACTLERKLAMEFVNTHAEDYPVLLIPPNLLSTYNMKPPPIGDYHNIDSALYFSSKYLQYISDSAFLENYFDGFTTQTKEVGLDLFFPNDLDQFINIDKQAFVVRIAQMELSEDTSKITVEEKIRNRPIKKDILYHYVSLSSWFDISIKDSSSSFTYFDEQYIADDVYGDFYEEFWNGNIRYDYIIREIENEDIIYFAQNMGQTHAQYLFDLMMNSYIWEKLPEERKGSFNYLHYNSQYKSIEVAEKAFIMMNN